MDFKKLGLSIIFVVAAALNYLFNPLLILGTWLTFAFVVLAIAYFLDTFKIELPKKLFKSIQKTEMKNLYLPIAIVLAALIIAGGLYYNAKNDPLSKCMDRFIEAHGERNTANAAKYCSGSR
jgi:uncharacterized membrane protein YbhN (UPF0104 family)